MKTGMQFLIVFLLLAALVLAGCAPAQIPSPQETAVEAGAIPEPSAETAGSAVSEAGSPGEVARLFYEAYTGSVRNHKASLASPEFEAKKYLSEAYLQQVAEIQAGFEGFGFDPVLQTQNDPPGPIEVKEVQVDNSQATVVLQFGRGVLEQPWERTVSLEMVNGEWQLVPDRLDGPALTPEETVETFYAWYLGYIGTGSQRRNPLSDRAYHAGPYLDRQFIHQVDALGAGEGGFRFDPFLCAQDVPEWMRVISSFENSAHPIVVLESSFTGQTLTVDLIRSNFNVWTIRNITCGGNPAGTAKAFYAWVLEYMTRDGEMHNPLREGALQGSPFLTPAFVQELEANARTTPAGGADPVLLAQNLPQSFNTAPCLEANCALVNMQFGESTIHQLRVEMAWERGALRITNINHPQQIDPPKPAEPLPGVTTWVPFRDEQYGYAIRYPIDWRPVGLKVTQITNPAENPVVRSIYFDNPNLTDPYYPISIDVFVGTAEQVSGQYGAGERLNPVTINGYTAEVYRYDPGIVEYVFQHPTQANTWILLRDSVTHFSGREEAAKQIEGVFEGMLSTITFAR